MYIKISIYDNKTSELLGQSKVIKYDYPDRLKERIRTWLDSYLRGLRSNSNLSILISSSADVKELGLFNCEKNYF